MTFYNYGGYRIICMGTGLLEVSEVSEVSERPL